MSVLSSTRHSCTRCTASFHPSLVGGACPVCRTRVHGSTARKVIRADDRLLLIVGLATVANLLVLAVTAIELL